MTTDFQTLLFEIKENIGWITINRPDKLNALNEQVLKELNQVLVLIEMEWKKNPISLHGIILQGAGDKAFIAGADISAMAKMSPEEAKTFGLLGQEVTQKLEALPLPVMALVQGYALGGGCEMAMACDFILATTQAVFGQPEVKLGLIPGFGGTQRLVRHVGLQKARELIYSGRNMKAQEAFNAGLVLDVFETASLMKEAAQKIIKSIGENSPHAVAQSKKVINASDLPLVQGLNEEVKTFATIFNSQDMKIGTQAFVAKQKPQFTGK